MEGAVILTSMYARSEFEHELKKGFVTRASAATIASIVTRDWWWMSARHRDRASNHRRMR